MKIIHCSQSSWQIRWGEQTGSEDLRDAMIKETEDRQEEVRNERTRVQARWRFLSLWHLSWGIDEPWRCIMNTSGEVCVHVWERDKVSCFSMWMFMHLYFVDSVPKRQKWRMIKCLLACVCGWKRRRYSHSNSPGLPLRDTVAPWRQYPWLHWRYHFSLYY